MRWILCHVFGLLGYIRGANIQIRQVPHDRTHFVCLSLLRLLGQTWYGRTCFSYCSLFVTGETFRQYVGHLSYLLAPSLQICFPPLFVSAFVSGKILTSMLVASICHSVCDRPNLCQYVVCLGLSVCLFVFLSVCRQL